MTGRAEFPRSPELFHIRHAPFFSSRSWVKIPIQRKGTLCFGQPRRLWGFRWMNRAHSVWGQTLGTVWERGGHFHCLPHKEPDHWEMSAFVHEAKVLRETPVVVSYSRKDSLFTNCQRLFPTNCHLAFLGHTSMRTYRGRAQGEQKQE